MKTLLLIAALFVGSGFLKSQDFRKDMMMINAKLKPVKKYEIDLHYRMYLDNNFAKPYQEKTVEVKKDSSKIICRNPTSEFVSNNQMNLYVDHRSKKMMILPDQKDDNKDSYLEFVNFVEANFDSVMKGYEKVTFKAIGGDIGEYQCVLKEGKYARVDIRFNKKLAQITSVAFFFRGTMRFEKIDKKEHSVFLRIDYEKFNLKPSFTPETFSTQKYVTKKGKHGYVPGLNYKGYEIYDQNNLQ